MAAAKAGPQPAKDDRVRLADVVDRVPRTSPGYLRGTSPDGVAVVFVPGELLPDWAAARLGGARFDEDAAAWLLPGDESAPS